MIEKKPTREFVAMILHWVTMMMMCFASVFIQYLFVTYTRNETELGSSTTELFKINYAVYIIGVVVGLIGFLGIWVALINKDWKKLASINIKWRVGCIIVQLGAAFLSLIVSCSAMLFSASFGKIKWYDIISEPRVLCLTSIFMFPVMIIIFLIYEEIVRPFAKNDNSEDSENE